MVVYTNVRGVLHCAVIVTQKKSITVYSSHGIHLVQAHIQEIKPSNYVIVTVYSASHVPVITVTFGASFTLWVSVY